jgi:uncharacterized membrane protein
VQSIDILRGIIMIIMAIDHVRDYFHIHAMDQSPTDMATTTPFLFFTRWITHFCAPTFVFLSGISAWLSGQKKSKKELSLFLIKRGIWLIVVEVCVMTLALTFDPFYHVIILQVIWAIGLSMIILGLLVNTSVTAVIIIGLLIVLGHNLFDYANIPQTTAAGRLLSIFIAGSHSFVSTGENRGIFVFYTAIPWTGIMLLGYGFGNLYNTRIVTEERRRKILFAIGGAVTILFFILRLVNKYGDPAPEITQKTWVFSLLSFLNVTKYPPSLDYTCMTLGAAILMLAMLERGKNKFTAFVSTYGKVPFFYYVLHFYIIHFLLVIVFFASGYGVKDIIDPDTNFFFRPLHFGFHLWVVYFIWASVVLALYRPCKWFNSYKATHKQWWLSYL